MLMGTISMSKLLVIWCVCGNCARAVKLLAQYNSAKLMWQSYLAKGKAQIALAFDSWMQAVASANDKCKGGVALLLLVDILGKLHAI